MATQAHAFYCFECLSASFEERDSPRLTRVIELYDRYIGISEPPTISNSHAEDDGEVIETEDDEEKDDKEDEPEPGDECGAGAPSILERPQIPSISRLQATTPSSRSSSSSSPSVLSANSSNSQLTAASTASAISSHSTYLSRLDVDASYPLFVTWNTISRSGHRSLRGCIGTFDPMPLETGLSTYALTSALDDHRFSPIPQTLISSLGCALTLLANFEPCKDAMDWTLGTHGLRISFTHRGRRYGATYLPDVAVEQGWSKTETVESLMKKAGWDGGSSYGVARRLLKGSSRNHEDNRLKPWDEVSDFRAIRYSGLRASATYTEWKDWRTWVSARNEVLR